MKSDEPLPMSALALGDLSPVVPVNFHALIDLLQDLTDTSFLIAEVVALGDQAGRLTDPHLRVRLGELAKRAGAKLDVLTNGSVTSKSVPGKPAVEEYDKLIDHLAATLDVERGQCAVHASKPRPAVGPMT